ncbi:YesL family protein [[Clostridium] polysaccharolyticum]|uniref:Uncharacterized membrane protein YesL n=1 Tax=[Clostridium] polysaccharolyticum TaxID=29364 RepID=A0A1I0DNZ0_9FIRM|nr:DUF624 domain-containing protein [[Clostridium] polysaccharolyticum]SET33598.1 Uncharacterized membrane protein YesL [[Clostridium] polysaccharolyticum]
MSSFFSLDNPVMRLLTKLFDVMFLSILWFVFSIPVISIGASTTAMYYTAVKVIRRDRGYIFQEFWKSFKLNFVQATIAWLAIGTASALFYYNVKFAFTLEGKMGTLMTIVYVSMGVAVLGCGAYIFPVLSRFTMKFGHLVKTSILLFFKHFPKSIVLALIVAVAAFLLYLSQMTVFFVPASAALLFSLVMEPILKLYTPKADNEEEKKDEWYLE